MPFEHENIAKNVHIKAARKAVFQAQSKATGYEKSVIEFAQRFENIRSILEQEIAGLLAQPQTLTQDDCAFFIDIEDCTRAHLSGEGRVYRPTPEYERAKALKDAFEGRV